MFLYLNTYKALLCHELLAVKQNDKPNIIFILTDDQGFSDVSWRNKQVRTPNLDALSFGFKYFFLATSYCNAFEPHRKTIRSDYRRCILTN